MYDVFISHSSKDKETIVNELAAELGKLGLNVWLDRNAIIAGDNILNKIKEGVELSTCIVLVLTTSFFQSLWVSLEIGLASSKSAQIIPVLVDVPIEIIATKFPFLLTLKYVILREKRIRETAEEICRNAVEIKRRNDLQESTYQHTARRLNNYDTPSLNKVAILLTEYEQLCKISILTGVKHAAQIAFAILDDICNRENIIPNDRNLNYHDKLQQLLCKGIGLNQIVAEHFDLLISVHGNVNWPSFSNEVDHKRMIDLSMASVVDWFITYIQTNSRYVLDSETLEIAGINELNFSDFQDMHDIDKLVLRPDLIAPPEVAFEWYRYNYYTHIAVRSSRTRKIVGYMALLPVTEELFEQIKQGDFKDNDLTTKHIRQYDIPDFYKLYAACIAIHPQYQNTLAFNRLYNGMIRLFYDLATEREIYITDIITEASTSQGEKLCKILRFSKYSDTALGTELYIASLLPPTFRLRGNFGGKLITFYQNKYNELRDLF